MKITNDKPTGKSTQSSIYHELFSQLTPENNCIVFDDMQALGRVSQALDAWAKRYIRLNTRIVTTKSFPADGKPRCWLIWPEPTKTQIRGNFPGVSK